jgi:phosphohistidine phosphatase SixA
MIRTVQLLAVLLAFCSRPALAADDAALWTALRAGGHVALMRHAEAPGIGDPPGFRLGDCSTQRNLSEEGRRQARMVGELFRNNGIARATLYSSQWCRCLDTAALLHLGPVTPLRALNSFFENSGREKEQTERIRVLIDERPAGATLLLVTHQVNITALTGVYPQSGEIVVSRPEGGKLVVLGRLRTLK